jgi:thiamine-phosphate pyrophosphorylase
MHLGVDFIQIREKDVSARELFEFTLAVLETRESGVRKALGTRIVVNARADVAFACGADGVHLPTAAPVETLPGLLVIRSCHTLEEIGNAEADFVTFGPVFATPGKGNPVGLQALKTACGLGKPVFALGGINWDNASACVEAGAVGIAGIRLFQDPGL